MLDFLIQVWNVRPCSQLKSLRQASSLCPCPSSCPCPCQLVKVAFMACRCFLYESDRVWERNADQTMWGERKPKGGNLKTTPPSEIFTTASTTGESEGERERERTEESRRKVRRRWRKWNQREGDGQRCKIEEQSCGKSRREAAVFIFTNDSVSFLMNYGTDGLRLVKYSH